MIDRIISLSVAKKWTVLFLVLMVTIWGGWSFNSLPIDAVPDITNVQVQINTVSQGLSPEDLEIKVTRPIELAVTGIPGIKDLRSLTKFGLSQVTVVFDDNSDVYRDRQMVSERLQTLTSFPPGVENPTLSPITTGLGEIVHFTLQIKRSVNANEPTNAQEVRELMRLKEIQEWTIKPLLQTVSGVAEVNSIGGITRQLQIQPDLQKMAQYRLSFSELVGALEQTNKNIGGGIVNSDRRQNLIQVAGQFRSVDQIKATPVRSLANFKTVKIGDVANIEFGSGTRTGAALVNGHQTILVTVMMLSGANSRTVSRAVAEKIQQIQNQHILPADVELVTLYNRSELVDATLYTVLHNLVVGAALVMIILFLLLGNFKAAFIVSLSIPVTLLITFGFMAALGISGNLMSLGALDFGIIVDAAVIVVDRCVAWLQNRRLQLSHLAKIEGATKEIRSAAGFGQIMVIAVFIPILGLTGIEGKMFRPMAQTFSIALAVALVLSFTLIPALSALLFTDSESENTPRIMRWFENVYEVSLKRALQFRAPILMAAFGLLVLGVLLFSRLGAEFLPKLDEGSLVLQLTRDPVLNLEASIEMQKKTEQALLSHPAIEKVFSRIGTPELATDPMGPNEVDNFVLLKDRALWSDGIKTLKSKEDLINSIMEKVKSGVPNQEISATQPIQMRFNDMLEGTKSDLTVKVYGDDLDSLKSDTEQIAKLLLTIPGSGDVQPEIKGRVPLTLVEPKIIELGRYSQSAGPILDSVQISMAGRQTGFFYEGLRPLPLVVRMSDEVRNRPQALNQLLVPMDDGLLLPLRNFVEIKNREIISPILRDFSQRRSAVLINPRGRDLEGFVKEAQTRIRRDLKLSPNSRVEWFGAFKNLQEARNRLLLLGPVAVLLVVAMLFSAFKSLSQTLLILVTVPLALVGGVIGLWLTGTPFSISTAVGFIALTGIAVLNGVVMLHTYNEVLKSVKRPKDWIVIASSSRLRAVLMTALVDIFGFIPMALSAGVGSEVQKPLAVVIIGGILTSTLLTLIVLPTIASFIFEEVN